MRLRWSRSSVHVTAEGLTGRRSEIRARAAVVALPLGVLRAPPSAPGRLEFVPSLDATHEHALARLASGNVVKLVLRFREPFWERDGRKKATYFHAASSPFPTFWTGMPVHAPVLTAWAGGPAADALAALPMRRLAEIAVDAFADIIDFPRAHAHALLEACFHHDWQTDPFARGAYAYSLVGGATAQRRFSRPIASTLFFAGEHTEGDAGGGTVDGALRSGERAAREVLHALGIGSRRAA